ncbi:MAG TPA: RodZ domain-containing protein [Vicinamibacterales bacterium]
MPDDPTREFGAYLREARERAGISLRAIAASTKISVPTLEALERNDVARLPGGIFVRAFVRAYAKEVGLDPAEAIRRFVARFPDASVEESPATYEANPEKIVVDGEPTAGRLWRTVLWILPIVLVIVYFGFGGRLSWWRNAAQPAVPRTEQPAEQPPPAPAAPVLTTPASIPSPEPSSAPANAGSGGPGVAVPAATTPLLTGERPTQAGDTTGAAAGAGRFQLTLAPRGRCWVTVRSNGKVVFSGTMNVGDRRDLILDGNVSLTLGNAGVMGVVINGQPARSLGGEGQVVTALMNIENLKTFLESR